MAARNAELSRLMRESAREKILAGSIAAVMDKGFHATSMDDVAASAGVSKGLPYRYFRSKEELLASAVRSRIGHLFDIGKALDRSAPPADRLAMLIDMLLDHVRRDPAVFRMYLSLSLDISTTKVVAKAIHSLQAPLDSYLASVRDVFVDLGSDDPDLDAFLFRSTLLGILLRMVRSIDAIPDSRMRTRLLQLFTGNR